MADFFIMLYSLYHINSISPYQVIKDTEETVRFITDDGVEYMVAFIEDDNLEIDHAYQLVISNISKTKTKGVDIKIGQTIAAIVNCFFIDNQNVLLFICDISDSHQAARNRKFSSWFQQYADLSNMMMETEVILVEDNAYFISVIYCRNSGKALSVSQIFHSYIHDLKSKLDY